MKIRAILWSVAVGVFIAGGLAHFRGHKEPAVPAPAVFVTRTVAVPAASATMPASVITPSDDELLHTATNGAAVEFVLDLERQWLADDPLDGKARVSRLLLALCNAGRFRTALALVNAAPTELQTNWLQLTFTRWASRQPQDAFNSLAAVTDSALRSLAFRAAADGWNQNDPGGLAAYAMTLPSSDNRAYALAVALDNWSLQDPAALGAWLNTLPRGAEFDYGAALMIAKSDSANRPPELAMQWVENLGNPVLRQDLFVQVLSEWSQSDPVAARHYVTAAAWLDDAQRHQILEGFFAAR